MTTYVNENSLRVTLSDSKVYLVANAPDWKVVFCNPENKKALTMTLPNWIKHFVQFTYAEPDWDRFKLLLCRKRLVKRDGRVLFHYDIAGLMSPNGLVPCTTCRNGKYLVLENKTVPPQACNILEKTCE